MRLTRKDIVRLARSDSFSSVTEEQIDHTRTKLDEAIEAHKDPRNITTNPGNASAAMRAGHDRHVLLTLIDWESSGVADKLRRRQSASLNC